MCIANSATVVYMARGMYSIVQTKSTYIHIPLTADHPISPNGGRGLFFFRLDK